MAAMGGALLCTTSAAVCFTVISSTAAQCREAEEGVAEGASLRPRRDSTVKLDESEDEIEEEEGGAQGEVGGGSARSSRRCSATRSRRWWSPTVWWTPRACCLVTGPKPRR
uniref:Secreted protein n=1 Tax=Oryza brachyantha TaxID=4533 RepID=J3MIX8_ORYBR